MPHTPHVDYSYLLTFLPAAAAPPASRLDFIIGRVVFLETHVAGVGVSNAYGLTAGSKYTVLHVEEVHE